MNQPNCGNCGKAREDHKGEPGSTFARATECQFYRPASDSTDGQGVEYIAGGDQDVVGDMREPCYAAWTLYRDTGESEHGDAADICDFRAGFVYGWQSLTAQAAALKRELIAANKGAETNAKVNQLMAADLLKARTALEELVEAAEAHDSRNAGISGRFQEARLKAREVLNNGPV